MLKGRQVKQDERVDVIATEYAIWDATNNKTKVRTAAHDSEIKQKKKKKKKKKIKINLFYFK
jgi:hypothetical protein